MSAKRPSSHQETPRVPLGGDYWEAEPTAPLWGFADPHAHLMAHLAFGGRAFWGEPYDSEHAGQEAMAHALASCEPVHGGLLDVNAEFGHPAGGGWPEFVVWPRFNTLVHQQAYIDWIYRAYQGGLRLITCLAVNNELLATKSDPELPTDDKSTIERQVVAMKKMAAFVEAQGGGPGKGWLQIAYSPEEARKIIAENRLAIILGVEVDSLGNWRKLEDLETLSHGDANEARRLIGAELDWLYGLGVRQITPIHLTNNAFGGTAIYMRFIETVNMFLTGERWEVEDAWESGVRYRLDRDGDGVADDLQRTIAIAGRKRTMNRRSLVDHIPGISDLFEARRAPSTGRGHANVRGLSSFGLILLQEMMARGMIIDVDHMSEKTLDAALALVEVHDYPVMCSHTWLRDLHYSAEVEFDEDQHEAYGTSDIHKVANEAGKRGDQIERIARLGGVIAPIINQGDMAGLRRSMPDLADKIPVPCTGSSTAWAQAYLYTVAKTGGRGVAIGTDVNGAAALPGPRFGPFAAFGAKSDDRRMEERRREIDRQTNGVAYDEPILDYRWHRFDAADPGAYDEEEEDIWQAIGQYQAGFNPWIHRHPDSDFPERSVRLAMEAARIRHDQDKVDEMTEGFWAADLRIPVADEQLEDWPMVRRAAYLARRQPAPETAEWQDRRTQALAARINTIWAQWERMQGDNRPLTRSKAGPRRDFDYNLDGMAHFGMLPDFLQDLRNVGLTAEDLAPLFRSAYDYIEMWRACEGRAADLSNAPWRAASETHDASWGI
ncbi:MAG: dipeptidase [Anaerolineae bacterium]|jgi:microsomal dipeptidase-like Zn-dependent dipeptidase|nr:dipeptidase [Anaerolineae bacterium]